LSNNTCNTHQELHNIDIGPSYLQSFTWSKLTKWTNFSLREKFEPIHRNILFVCEFSKAIHCVGTFVGTYNHYFNHFAKLAKIIKFISGIGHLKILKT
jgi:hypothetical protein